MSEELYPNSDPLTKGELRRRLRSVRSVLPREELSRAVQMHILNDICWQTAQIVALYVAMPEEIDTMFLWNMARVFGKQVWLPRCLTGPKEGSEMEFALCPSVDKLVRGRFGILEPDPRLCPAVLEDILPDLMLVPGVAFDRHGFRLGYGGGYYDRLLSRPGWNTVPTLGVVSSTLLLQDLPHEDWDRPVKGLATEEGVLWL